MERHYIFFRTWEHFSPSFHVEEFDDLSDDEINGAVEKYFVDYPRDHKKRFRRRTHKKAGRLAVALKNRAEQRTHRPDGPIRRRRQMGHIQLGPGPECSPGCQNAYRMGLISDTLRRFGGLSPSPQWFLVAVEGEQCAKEAVDVLYKLLPSTEGWVDYGHLQIRFGYLPASRFDTAKQVEIELGMEDLSIITPGTFGEDVQQQLADVALRVVRKVTGILKREAERSGTPAVAAGAAVEGTMAGKTSATTKPPCDAGDEKPIEDGPRAPLPSVEPAKSNEAMAQEPDSNGSRELKLAVTDPEVHGTFCREGDGWRLEFGEERAHHSDLKGFSMVHALLSSPGDPIPVSDLGHQQTDSLVKQPVMDREYQANARQQLDEFDTQIERAEAENNVTMAEVYRRERQEVEGQLAANSALSGKSRTFKDESERVRNRVSKQISSVSERLQQCNPPLPKLAIHLLRSIVSQAGSYTYQPEQHVTWKLG